MSRFDIKTCARPNVLALQPYRCARDEHGMDRSNVLLDLNENSFGPSLPCDVIPASPIINGGCDLQELHRYPDRWQLGLKSQLCQLRTTDRYTESCLTAENIFIGTGSVEAFDLLIRCFCRPEQDSILTCPPTYGMYGVSAQVNDVRIRQIPLLSAPNFALNVNEITRTLHADDSIKLAYFASPGNPTGSLLSQKDIFTVLLHPTWNGVVVLDEAYIDYSADGASLAELVTEYPNLVVVQSLSKAFGMAGIRIGIAFASPPIIRLLNSVKAPWNIPSTSSALASYAISAKGQSIMRAKRARMYAERTRLLEEVPKIKSVGRLRSGTDSNFLMFEILNTLQEPDNATARSVYAALAKRGRVLVRYRGDEPGCLGCLRITVGTRDETTTLLRSLREVLAEIQNNSI